MEIKAFKNHDSKSLYSLVQRGGSVCAIEIANGFIFPTSMDAVLLAILHGVAYATVTMPDSVALKPNYYFKGSKVLSHEAPEGHAVRPEMAISDTTKLRGVVAFDHPEENIQYFVEPIENKVHALHIDGSITSGKFVEFVKAICNHDIEDYEG